jgi:hypothetical protein
VNPRSCAAESPSRRKASEAWASRPRSTTTTSLSAGIARSSGSRAASRRTTSRTLPSCLTWPLPVLSSTRRTGTCCRSAARQGRSSAQRDSNGAGGTERSSVQRESSSSWDVSVGGPPNSWPNSAVADCAYVANRACPRRRLCYECDRHSTGNQGSGRRSRRRLPSVHPRASPATKTRVAKISVPSPTGSNGRVRLLHRQPTPGRSGLGGDADKPAPAWARERAGVAVDDRAQLPKLLLRRGKVPSAFIGR